MMTDKEFLEFTDKTVKGFSGQFDELYSALGVMLVGRYVGWRVVRLTLSEKTYKKYKDILGVDFKDELRERDLYTYKSVGLALVDKIGNFWEVVSGHATGQIDRKEKRLIK